MRSGSRPDSCPFRTRQRSQGPISPFPTSPGSRIAATEAPLHRNGQEGKDDYVRVHLTKDLATMAKPRLPALLAGTPQDRSGLCSHSSSKQAIQAKVSLGAGRDGWLWELPMDPGQAPGTQPGKSPSHTGCVLFRVSQGSSAHSCPYPSSRTSVCPHVYMPRGPGCTFFRLPLRVPMKTTECWW